MLKLSAELRAKIGQNVFGQDNRARFYHQGHYYDASGDYLFSNPGTARPAMGTVATPIEPTPPTGTEGDSAPDRATALVMLNASSLQKLQRGVLKTMQPEATEEAIEAQVFKGEGCKSKLVQWLLENTAE